MKPIVKPWTNTLYKGDGDKIGDLPCARLEPGVIAAEFEFTQYERDYIAAGGNILLVQSGEPIHPVSLSVILGDGSIIEDDRLISPENSEE